MLAARPKYNFPKPNNNGKLPFSRLPSLLATATVLSYVEYRPEVEALMKQLSRTSNRYTEENNLKGFLKEYVGISKHIEWVINFGPHSLGTQSYVFPSPKDLW